MISYMLSWFEHESGPGWTFCLNCLQGVKLHGRGFHLKPWNVWSLWWYSVADPEGLARPPLRSPTLESLDLHLQVLHISHIKPFEQDLTVLYENSNQNPPELQVDYRRNWHGISIFQLELTRRWNTCKNPGGITERFHVDFSDSSWKLSITWNFFLRIYPPGMFPNSI